MIWALFWYTQSPFLAALIGVAGILVVSERRLALAASLIAITAVMKPFALIMLVPFWRHMKRRTALIGLGTFAALNVAGMVLRSLDLVDVYQALSLSNEYWFSSGSNISLASWFNRGEPLATWIMVGSHAAVLGLLLLYLRGRRAPLSIELVAFGLVGLLISPLSWPHYMLIVLPLVWLLWANQGLPRSTHLAIAIGLVCWVWAQPLWIYFVGTVFMFVGAAVAIPRKELSRVSPLVADGVT